MRQPFHPMVPRIAVACLVAAVIAAADVHSVFAQSLAWRDGAFLFRRSVDIPKETEPPDVVVSDFLTHGQLRPDGSNLAVYCERDMVPFQVLQVAPGDYCRVAFQTLPKQFLYHVYYGGEKRLTGGQRPKFATKHGLLLETRRWVNCDLNSLASVRKAFESAESIGSDFVDQVFHAHNPFDHQAAPFFSRYTGRMMVPESGKIAFYTSSQDCSFLLINGQVIVASPGRHAAVSRARNKGELHLEKGPHHFEYLHAAGGNQTCMVAAWQLPNARRPVLIPASVFEMHRIAHLPAVRLEHHSERYLPDFRLAILGDIPSADDRSAMVRVQFADLSAKSVSLNAQQTWHFGDGQTADGPNPVHIFLHPGEYEVTLTVHRGVSEKRMVNRLQISRAIIRQRDAELDDLTSYINILKSYNAAQLDSEGLVQMVRTLALAEMHREAVQAGQAAFASSTSSYTEAVRMDLLRTIGPLLRHELGDADGAAKIYRAAASLVQRRDWRMECVVEAADILLNDLLSSAEAKRWLEMAGKPPPGISSEQESKLHRVWGDWYARSGEAAAARSAYAKASGTRKLPHKAVVANAWRGAYSRSSESLLNEGDLVRFRKELHRWQSDFPADKIDGYLPFLEARYWTKREMYPQAIAVANDLLVVNPESPYADRMVYLIASCEKAQNQFARAFAAYQSLLADYPGSALVEKAREEMEELKVAGQVQEIQELSR